MTALLETRLDLPVRRGKVRDIYDLGQHLLMISTDRISAFDWVLPTGIPDKGRILTQISAFWFERLGAPNHLISLSLDDVELPPHADREALEGRSMIVRKCDVAPVECVVRGYLDGSGWKEYLDRQEVCGIPLPPGIRQGDRLESPIFTPATKAEQGHDENISFERMSEIVGAATAETLRRKSLEIYQQGSRLALERGILIADTKFEWGWAGTPDGGRQLILIDEVLTPDSSRFWPQQLHRPGGAQPSFDKQFVRDWLSQSGWDKNSPPPELPADVVARTREKYIEAFEQLTGREFPWK